jgi:hypothetical protein
MRTCLNRAVVAVQMVTVDVCICVQIKQLDIRTVAITDDEDVLNRDYNG